MERITKRVYVLEVEGARKWGKLRKRWKYVVKDAWRHQVMNIQRGVRCAWYKCKLK